MQTQHGSNRHTRKEAGVWCYLLPIRTQTYYSSRLLLPTSPEGGLCLLCKVTSLVLSSLVHFRELLVCSLVFTEESLFFCGSALVALPPPKTIHKHFSAHLNYIIASDRS